MFTPYFNFYLAVLILTAAVCFTGGRLLLKKQSGPTVSPAIYSATHDCYVTCNGHVRRVTATECECQPLFPEEP